MAKSHELSQFNESLLSKHMKHETLELTNENGNKVTLHTNELSELFAATEKSLQDFARRTSGKKINKTNDNITELSANFLGRFGLKTPNQVMRFLNSPAGGTVKAKISGKLIELSINQKRLEFEQREKKLREHWLLAAFILLAMKAKKARAQFNEHLQQQIDNRLKENEKIIRENYKASQYDKPSKVEERINALQEALTINAKELEILDQQFDKILKNYQEKDKEILKSQEAFNKYMDTADEELTKLLNHQEANDIKKAEEKDRNAILHSLDNSKKKVEHKIETKMKQVELLADISRTFDEIGSKGNKLKKLNEKAHRLMHLDKSNTSLNSEVIDALNKETKLNFYKRINNLPDKNYIQEKINNVINKVLQQSDQLYGKFGEIEKTQDVIKGKEVFCDKFGNEVSKKDARLVLPYSLANELKENEKRLEKGPDGKYYLLKKDQVLDNLSREEKEQAQKDALKLKPQERLLSREYKENYTKFERRANKETTDDKIDWNQAKKAHKLMQQNELSNELAHVQAKQAAAQNNLQQGNSLKLSPAPPRPSNINWKASENDSASQIKAILANVQAIEANEELLTQLKEVTQQGLKANQDVNDELHTTIVKDAIDLNRLQPGDRMEPELFKRILSNTQIPENTMSSLLQNVERFAIRVDDNLDRQKDNTPTPFSMKPTPFEGSN